MYSNLNVPPTLGANVPPNMAPMPSYTAPAYGCGYGYGYGYAAPIYDDCRNDFILIVVLFILLIIVGACFYDCNKC
jgi:uncharacterized protein (TIGR01732 family)